MMILCNLHICLPKPTASAYFFWGGLGGEGGHILYNCFCLFDLLQGLERSAGNITMRRSDEHVQIAVGCFSLDIISLFS